MNNRDMKFPLEGSNDEAQWESDITPDFFRQFEITGFAPNFLVVPFGFTYSQRKAAKSFYIQSHHFDVREDFTVAPFTQSALAIHYQLEGCIPARLYDQYRINLVKGQYNAFDLSGDQHRADLIAGKVIYHCFHIDIDPAHLSTLVEKYPALQPIATRLAARPGMVLNKRSLVISPAAHLCLEAIRKNWYTDEVAEHYLFSICINLYAQYARQVDIIEGHTLEYFRISDPHLLANLKDMFRDIRTGATLGIDATFLAKRYNTTRMMINALFIQNFFISADDLITAIRMNTAFHLIRKVAQYTTTTESVIARRAGYQNHQRFPSTFFKTFGLWPEALAKL